MPSSEFVGDALEVEDLGSRNGTKVNGEQITTRSRTLGGGDTVELGGTVIEVESLVRAERS